MWYFWTLFWPEQRAVDLMQMWGENAVWGHLSWLFIKIMNVMFPGTASTTANITYLQLSLNICLLLKKNSPRNAFRVSSAVAIIPLESIFFIHPDKHKWEIHLDGMLHTCYRHIIHHVCSWKHKNHQLSTSSMMGCSMILRRNTHSSIHFHLDETIKSDASIPKYHGWTRFCCCSFEEAAPSPFNWTPSQTVFSRVDNPDKHQG